MTQQQRREIENQFYAYKDGDNALWRTIFENTLKKFRWEQEERVMQMKFIENRQRYNICKELQLPKRTYYLYLERIYQTAFMWAVELRAL